MLNDWEYGKNMLDDDQIDSLDNWSDKKEFVYKIMDRKFDYIWWESDNGFHFCDRIYYDFRWSDEFKTPYEDNLIREREKDHELQLWFKTLDEAIEWLKRKGVIYANTD